MRELQLHVQLAVTTGVVQNYSLCRVDYWQTHVDECADTWYKRIQATETVKLYSCPETCQRACVNQNWPMGWLYTVVLWRSYQHRHDTWLPVCYFVAVEPYRLGRHQHCCCCHNIISSGSPPALHECTNIIYYLLIKGAAPNTISLCRNEQQGGAT